MRKLLHPLYVLYQFVFAIWAGIFLTMLASLIIWFFGGILKIKNADYYPAIVWCRLMCIVFLIMNMKCILRNMNW